MQDRIFRIVEIFLHRTAGPYIWVIFDQSLRIFCLPFDVRFAPKSMGQHPAEMHPQQALPRPANLVESIFNRIKQCRRVATRYDKLAADYLALVQLASIRLWLRVNESAPRKPASRAFLKTHPASTEAHSPLRYLTRVA
jgi:hypothetical protein